MKRDAAAPPTLTGPLAQSIEVAPTGWEIALEREREKHHKDKDKREVESTQAPDSPGNNSSKRLFHAVGFTVRLTQAVDSPEASRHRSPTKPGPALPLGPLTPAPVPTEMPSPPRRSPSREEHPTPPRVGAARAMSPPRTSPPRQSRSMHSPSRSTRAFAVGIDLPSTDGRGSPSTLNDGSSAGTSATHIVAPLRPRTVFGANHRRLGVSLSDIARVAESQSGGSSPFPGGPASPANETTVSPGSVRPKRGLSQIHRRSENSLTAQLWAPRPATISVEPDTDEDGSAGNSSMKSGRNPLTTVLGDDQKGLSSSLPVTVGQSGAGIFVPTPPTTPSVRQNAPGFRRRGSSQTPRSDLSPATPRSSDLLAGHHSDGSHVNVMSSGGNLGSPSTASHYLGIPKPGGGGFGSNLSPLPSGASSSSGQLRPISPNVARNVGSSGGTSAMSSFGVNELSGGDSLAEGVPSDALPPPATRTFNQDDKSKRLSLNELAAPRYAPAKPFNKKRVDEDSYYLAKHSPGDRPQL